MLTPFIQDKILFPEILWQRPINIYQKRGRVLVLGAEKNVQQTILFCEALYQTKLQRISLGYPDNFSDVYRKILPAELHFPLPSDKFGTFNISAYEKIIGELKNYDLIVIGSGISKNKETQKLIEKLVSFHFPILLTHEAVSVLENIEETFTKETPTVVFLNSKIAANILSEKEKEFKENLIGNFNNLVSKLRNVIVLADEDIFVGKSDKIVITRTKVRSDIIAVLIAAFWAWNIKKPFESACTASYIAKIWQENFSQISDLQKAMEKMEQEIERG